MLYSNFLAGCVCVCVFRAVGASSGLDGYIKLWNIETGKLLKSIDGGPGKG